MSTPQLLASQPKLSGVGSLLRYAHRPLQRFEDARSYSARATAFQIFDQYHLTLFDPELIEQVLVTDHASFSKDLFVRDLEAVLGKGLLNSEGAQWRRQRKLTAPSLRRSEIAVFLQSGDFQLTRGPLLRLTPALTLRPSGPVLRRFERH
ncbi:MAG: cytochrome P450 [Polyangiaceae bacterium]